MNAGVEWLHLAVVVVDAVGVVVVAGLVAAVDTAAEVVAVVYWDLAAVVGFLAWLDWPVSRLSSQMTITVGAALT